MCAARVCTFACVRQTNMRCSIPKNLSSTFTQRRERLCVIVSHVRDTASEMYGFGASIRCVQVEMKGHYRCASEANVRSDRDECKMHGMTFCGDNFRPDPIRAEILNQIQKTL